MTTVDYLIVGGGIAGTTAAETIRKHDREGTIVLLNAEPHRLYSRVLLPHFVKGLLEEDKLFLRTPGWYQEQHIELKTNTRMVQFDPIDHTAELSSGEVIRYGKMLLAAGGFPREWHVPGNKKLGVTSLWTLGHARNLRDLLSHARGAVIVGGGFIASDLISIFQHVGVTTTLIMRHPHLFFGVLDASIARYIHKQCFEAGITIVPNSEVAEVVGDLKVEEVVTDRGERIRAQAIALGIGLVFDFSSLSGSAVAVRQGIRTNEYLETGVPDVYAAGDATEFYDAYLGIWHKVGNWTNSQEQGRIAGANMVADTRMPFARVSAYGLNILGTSLIFIGDVQSHPDVQVVRRGDPIKAQAMFFLYKGRVIGATLLDMPHLREATVQLIESHIDVSKARGTLEDETVDLATFVREQKNKTYHACPL